MSDAMLPTHNGDLSANSSGPINEKGREGPQTAAPGDLVVKNREYHLRATLRLRRYCRLCCSVSVIPSSRSPFLALACPPAFLDRSCLRVKAG